MDSSKVGDGVNAGADAGKQANWWPPTPLNPNAPSQPSPLPQKTPISLLQEGCLKKGLTPAYELMATEGQVHEPTFMYRVTVQDMNACGSGKSKKIAKHLAAKGILEQIVATGKFGEWGIPGNTVGEAREYLNSLLSDGKPAQPKVQNPAEGEGDGDGNPAENPIGRLQEKCTKNRWPLPEYDLVEERGQPHDRTFVVTVKLGRYEEKAEAKSKKIAKRMVAEQMIKRLGEIPRDDEDTLIEKFSTALKLVNLRGNTLKASTALDIQRLEAFFGPLKNAPGESLRAVRGQGTVKATDCPRLLSKIAEEYTFPVSYTNLPRRADGEYQCLVQLSTTPVAVCYGSGASKDEAHCAAARNALEYLKVMSKAG